MTKKGPLSKAEKHYIESFCVNQDIQSLCKDLDRAQSIVSRYVEECNSKRKTPLAEQFASNRGSTVMTENASSMGDQLRGKVNHTSRSKGCTTSVK